MEAAHKTEIEAARVRARQHEHGALRAQLMRDAGLLAQASNNVALLAHIWADVWPYCVMGECRADLQMVESFKLDCAEFVMNLTFEEHIKSW